MELAYGLIDAAYAEQDGVYGATAEYIKDIRIISDDYERLKSKPRSNKQNAYYWRSLEEIAQQATMQGRKFNSFAWHIYCKMEIMPIEFEDKKGNIITKYVQLPNGETTLKSTTVMSKKAFADYITAVEAFGASLGVKFSVNYMEG